MIARYAYQITRNKTATGDPLRDVRIGREQASALHRLNIRATSKCQLQGSVVRLQQEYAKFYHFGAIQDSKVPSKLSNRRVEDLLGRLLAVGSPRINCFIPKLHTFFPKIAGSGSVALVSKSHQKWEHTSMIWQHNDFDAVIPPVQ